MGRICWLLAGPRDLASSRIHGYRIHEYLLRRGWQSGILFSPPEWVLDAPFSAAAFLERGAFRPGDAVVCQKLRGVNTRSILEGLRELGAAAIYVDCDLPLKIDEARLATITVCSSRYLAEQYLDRGVAEVQYIPDAYEWHAPPKDRGMEGPLRCVWFGNTGRGKWSQVENLRRPLTAAGRGWSVLTISACPGADIKWDLHTAWKLIAACDVAVLPGSEEVSGWAKSSNRAIQAMALGLPVAAYPIPSYREAIRPGRNGFLCKTDGEWVAALRQLEDPVTRRRMSRTAYRYATRFFSIDRIGARWESLFARF
jgi:hypothetical protein